MEKIMVTPKEVRGYGNILESKVRSDFIRFHSELNNGESTVTVDNLSFSYYTMKLEGLQINIAVPSWPNAVLDTNYTIPVTVTTVEGGNAVPNVIVTLRDAYKLNESLAQATTNSNGVCNLTFTPDTLGDLTLFIEILSQNQYAEGTKVQGILVGINMGIPQLVTDVSFDSEEDDYVIAYKSDISSRNNLTDGFVSNIYIAEGGESLIDEEGVPFTAEEGDVLIEHKKLPTHTESAILFEDDINTLSGAIHDIYQDTNNNRYRFMKTRYTDDYTNFMEED